MSALADVGQCPDPGAVRFAPQQPTIHRETVHPEGRRLGGSWGHRHPLPDLELLEFLDDLARARDSEIVQQVVAVKACLQAAHLDEPRPDRLRRRVDGDRAGASELGLRTEIVAGKCARRLRQVVAPQRRCRSSVERRRQEERQITGDIGDLTGKLGDGRPWRSPGGRWWSSEPLPCRCRQWPSVIVGRPSRTPAHGDVTRCKGPGLGCRSA